MSKEQIPSKETFSEKAKRLAKHVGIVALVGAGIVAVL